MQTELSLLPRDAILQLRASKIREVANAGMDRKDVLAFWFGEPDEVTPDFIRSAASESLLRGETFYSHNLGLPELRNTVAAYLSGLHENPAAAIIKSKTPTISTGNKYSVYIARPIFWVKPTSLCCAEICSVLVTA